MKALILVQQLPPAGRSAGRLALEYGKLLKSRGVEVDLLTAAPLGGRAARRVEDLPVHAVAGLPFAAPTAFLQATLDAFRLSRHPLCSEGVLKGVDVLLSFDWSTAVAGLALKRARRTPLVHVYNGAEPARASGQGKDLEWVIEMEGWACNCADAVVTPSPWASAELSGRFKGLPPTIECISACAVWPSSAVAVDREEFRLTLAEPQERIILWVGAGKRRNGFDFFLSCLPEILYRNPTTRIVIAGAPPDEEELSALLDRARATGRARVLGEVGDVVLEGLFRVADLLVSPARYDPSGVGLWHAALRGVPILSTPSDAAREARDQGGAVTIVEPARLASAAISALEPAPARSDAGWKLPCKVEARVERSAAGLEAILRRVTRKGTE